MVFRMKLPKGSAGVRNCPIYMWRRENCKASCTNPMLFIGWKMEQVYLQGELPSRMPEWLAAHTSNEQCRKPDPIMTLLR